MKKRRKTAILLGAMLLVGSAWTPGITSMAAPAQTTENAKTEGYVLPDSDKRLYSLEELMVYTPQQLKIARNEIYARHGRRFADKELQAYFDNCTWYQGTIEPQKFDNNVLSDIELKNTSRIAQAESLWNLKMAETDPEYILPDGDKRVYTAEELQYLTDEQLRLARNEVYARHGRMFSDPQIRSYFQSRSWYKGTIPADQFSESLLTKIDQQNIQMIRSEEKRRGEAAASKSLQYILPDSDKREYSDQELKGLTQEELRLARNEIYARHGRRFADAAVQAWFDKTDWYKGTIEPKDFDISCLTQVENKNIAHILNAEKNLNSQPQNVYENCYILPDSDKREYSAEELAKLTPEQLRLARNEIYARHGRRFADAELQAWFNQCSWYNGTIAPQNFDNNVLTDIEARNIRKIEQAEAARTEKAESSGTGYILPESNTRVYSIQELQSLSAGQLRLARNEIYARHGRRFSNSELQNYFNGCSWYNGTIAPENFDEGCLNDAEKSNIQQIMQVEKGETGSITFEMKNRYYESKTESGELVYFSEINYPVFSGSSAGAAFLNERYSFMVGRFDSGSEESLNFARYLSMMCSPEGYPYFENLWVECHYNKNGLISVYEITSSGNAQTTMQYSSNGITVDVNSGRVLTVEDLIQGTEEERRAVLAYCFERSMGPGYYASDSVIEALEEFTPYYLTEHGIFFFYNDGTDSTTILVPFTANDSGIVRAAELLP